MRLPNPWRMPVASPSGNDGVCLATRRSFAATRRRAARDSQTTGGEAGGPTGFRHACRRVGSGVVWRPHRDSNPGLGLERAAS